MTSSLISVGLFLGVLACLPLAIKWLKQRAGADAPGGSEQARVVSAVAVGPHQRVVTVEVGQEGARVRLTLGVTAQSITCLHTASADKAVSIST
jgi:flagellar protein FliO/FliZ